MMTTKCPGRALDPDQTRTETREKDAKARVRENVKSHDHGLDHDLGLDRAPTMKTSTRRTWSCSRRTWASSSRKLESASRWDPKMRRAETTKEESEKNFLILIRFLFFIFSQVDLRQL